MDVVTHQLSANPPGWRKSGEKVVTGEIHWLATVGTSLASLVRWRVVQPYVGLQHIRPQKSLRFTAQREAGDRAVGENANSTIGRHAWPCKRPQPVGMVIKDDVVFAAAQDKGNVGGSSPCADPIDLPVQGTASQVGIGVDQITRNGLSAARGSGLFGVPMKPGFITMEIGAVE